MGAWGCKFCVSCNGSHWVGWVALSCKGWVIILTLSPILELSANQRPLSHVNSPCNTIPVFTFCGSYCGPHIHINLIHQTFPITWLILGSCHCLKMQQNVGGKRREGARSFKWYTIIITALLYKTLQFHTIPRINIQMVRWCSLQWWCAKMSRGITTVSVSSRYWYENRYQVDIGA